MKKEVSATTLKYALDDLVEDIKQEKITIIRYFSSDKFLIEDFFASLELKERQLVILKTALQKVNLQKHEDGKTNSEYIFELSNLNNRKDILLNLDPSKKNSQWTHEKLTEEIKKIDIEINKIKNKLTIFNNSKKVKVEVLLENLFPDNKDK
jgi:hypothetical protein